MSRDAGDQSGSFGSKSAGASSGGGVSVDSGTRSIPAPRWLGKRVGRFKLVALLGQGAMGRVFRAEDTLMGRHVALKVLPKSLKKGTVKLSPEVLINEARAAAAIEHPNAVQIYEVNQAGDVCYVAMELLEGGSLRELVHAAGPLDVTRACLLCAEAAEALAAAHAAGVVHRDVKPANLMLSRQGRCKVVDFGLARLESPGDWGLAAESVGTPQFIAPEILSGTPASAQSDIYSLGGTLWYLLTGKAPYQGKDAQELLRMHMDAPIPDIRSVRPEAPAGLADALRTALAKRPADRFSNMEQLARVLRVHAIPVPGLPQAPPQPPSTDAGGRSRRPATPLDPASRAAAPSAPDSDHAPGRLRGGRWMVIAGVAAVVAAIVVVISIIAMHHGAPPVADSAPVAAPPPTTPAVPTSPAPIPTVQTTAAPPTPARMPPVPVVPTPAPVLRLGDFEAQDDVGVVGHRGYMDFDAPHHRYSVTSAGKDIFGHADAFHFVWRKVSGDVTIKATVTLLGDNKDTSQKGVLIIRQSLDPGSVFVDAAFHAGGALAMQARPEADGVSVRKVSSLNGSTIWLQRRGNDFALYVANAEGRPIETASMSLQMTDPVYLGLGVSSHDTNKMVTAVFSDVSLQAGAQNPQ
jgi:tRNA A-37 threonylcarbamoyl transferase component Bud32